MYVNKGKIQYIVADDSRRGLGGAYLSWSYKEFETSFFAFLKELSFVDLLDDEWKAKREAVEVEISRISETRRGFQANLDRLVNAVAEGNPPKAIIEKITSIEVQIDGLDKEIEKMREEAEQQRQLEADTVRTENKTQSLLARRDEPQARELIRKEIRMQVERIQVFGGGPAEGLRDFGDMFFANVGPEQGLTVEELKTVEGEEIVISKLREAINNRNPATMIPNDKAKRFFKVFFKTGAIKYVMPDHKDPTKLLRVMFTPESKGEEVPGTTVELGNGMAVSIRLDSPKQSKRAKVSCP